MFYMRCLPCKRRILDEREEFKKVKFPKETQEAGLIERRKSFYILSLAMQPIND